MILRIFKQLFLKFLVTKFRFRIFTFSYFQNHTSSNQKVSFKILVFKILGHKIQMSDFWFLNPTFSKSYFEYSKNFSQNSGFQSSLSQNSDIGLLVFKSHIFKVILRIFKKLLLKFLVTKCRFRIF